MILTGLSDRLGERLRRAGLDGFRPIALTEEAISIAALSPGDLLIIDPAALRSDTDLLQRVCLAINSRGAQCAFFTEFSPDHMRAVGWASALEPRALWIAGIDDADPNFRHRVFRLTGHALVLETLQLLRSAIDQLPWRVASAMTRLFAEPERFFDASDFSRTAGLSRRSADRQLVRHEFSPASRIIVAVKLLHAAAQLQRASAPVREVARALGYSAQEVLSRQCVRVLGCHASQLAEVPASIVRNVIACVIYPSAASLIGEATVPAKSGSASGAGTETSV